MNAERAQSVSILHYDHFRLTPPRYRRHGLMVRRHNIVSARLRLGYRPLWQVSEAGDVPHYTCKLCDRPNANSLHHYCLEWPSVRDLLPQGQEIIAVCRFLLKDSNLDTVLVHHPHFGGAEVQMSLLVFSFIYSLNVLSRMSCVTPHLCI